MLFTTLHDSHAPPIWRKLKKYSPPPRSAENRNRSTRRGLGIGGIIPHVCTYKKISAVPKWTPSMLDMHS